MSSKKKGKGKLLEKRKRHVVGKEEKYRQERDKSDEDDEGVLGYKKFFYYDIY